MNNKIEGEEYNISELQHIKEYISFDAEDFKCAELINNKMEELDVSEIKLTSFPVENENINKDNKTSKKNDNLLKRILKSTTTSGSMSTSLGSAGVLMVATVAGAGMVLTPILNNKSVEVLNCYVEYQYDENLNENTSDVVITFNEKLQEEFVCEIINENTKEKIVLNPELDYVVFENLELDKYEFKVNLKNAIGEVIDEKNISIDTNLITEYKDDVPFDYLLSYNGNNTSNLYFTPFIDQDILNEYKIETKLFLNNDKYIQAKYTSYQQDNIAVIENIVDENFVFQAKTYIVKDDNYYLLSKYPSIYMETNNFSNNSIDIIGKKLNVTINDEVVSDINLKVVYKDDNSFTSYIIKKDDIKKEVPISLELEKLSENIDVIINCEIINNYYVTNDSIVNYKGLLSKYINKTLNFKLDSQSQIEIKRVEFLNNTYNYDATDNVNRFYFDGFLLDESYLNMYIYDQDNQLVQTIENITDLSKHIDVLDLDKQKLYTLEYQFFDKTGISEKKSYSFDINKPSSMENISVNYAYTNPGDVYLTYNDDKTYNAYFYTNFSVEGDYKNVCYKINLTSFIEGESVTFYEVLDDRSACSIENIDSSLEYSLQHYVFAVDGINYYSLSNNVIPSGTIGINCDENGRVMFGNMTIDSIDNNIYNCSCDGMIYSDLNVEIIYDDLDSENIIIPFENITVTDPQYNTCSFTIDLSNKQKTISKIIITGEKEIYNYFTTKIKEVLEVKGNEVVPFIYEYGG